MKVLSNSKAKKFLFWVFCSICVSQRSYSQVDSLSLKINNTYAHTYSKAFRIAVGDVASNIVPYSRGLTEHKPCLMAGLYYPSPFIRDLSINIWNGFAMLSPEVSRNSLYSLLALSADNKLSITGSGGYWDQIIFAIGAWQYYLATGDRTFLSKAYEAVTNTLAVLEKEEYTEKLGLFRGPAVYGDGVSAYPKIYTESEIREVKNGAYSGIDKWPQYNPSRRSAVGHGIPMHALSTNLVYYQVYVLLNEIEDELKVSSDRNWKLKANLLKSNIEKWFWNREKKTYNYLVDDFGGSDFQEGMGLAMALLFNVPDKSQVAAIIEKTVIEEAGIPCVYPSFDRYLSDKGGAYMCGRHSGTVWPHIQGLWADAMVQHGKYQKFLFELNNLAQHAIRDGQFLELYHPKTGLPYGGEQEMMVDDPRKQEGKNVWQCASRQTWSATAFIRMIFNGLVGMRIGRDGIHFQPYLPDGIKSLELSGIKYREAVLDIQITGTGGRIKEITLNDGKNSAFIPNDISGHRTLKIILE